MSEKRQAAGRDTLIEADWPVYSLFGLNLSSNFPFVNKLLPGYGEPDLSFHRMEDPIAPARLNREPVYTSPYRDITGLPALFLYRDDGGYLLRGKDTHQDLSHAVQETGEIGIVVVMIPLLLGQVAGEIAHVEGEPIELQQGRQRRLREFLLIHVKEATGHLGVLPSHSALPLHRYPNIP